MSAARSGDPTRQAAALSSDFRSAVFATAVNGRGQFERECLRRLRRGVLVYFYVGGIFMSQHSLLIPTGDPPAGPYSLRNLPEVKELQSTAQKASAGSRILEHAGL